jgi:hypothetical protein
MGKRPQNQTGGKYHDELNHGLQGFTFLFLRSGLKRLALGKRILLPRQRPFHTFPPRRFCAVPVRQAILEHLDDLEDLYQAERTLDRIRSGEQQTIPLEDALKWHSLED